MTVLSRCSHQPSGRPQDRTSHSCFLGAASNPSCGCSLPEALPSIPCSSLVEEARPDWITACSEPLGERATFLSCLVSCFASFPDCWFAVETLGCSASGVGGGNILSGPSGLFILLKERRRHITFLSLGLLLDWSRVFRALGTAAWWVMVLPSI